MQAFRVEHVPDGKWQVVSGDGGVVAAGLSNSEAWKLVDRMASEANTPREHVSDWFWNKIANDPR